MGDGRAEGSSATGDGGQAAISLTPDVDGTHIHIFERSRLGDCRGLTVSCQRDLEENWTTGRRITTGEAEQRACVC